MLGSKKFEKTILYLTIIAMIFAAFTVCFPNFFSKISKNNAEPEYPTKLFGQNVINIEITANETEWDDMVENKMSKPYISCNLKIDGREFNDVGIRPKGNSSLTSIQNDKISYRLDFDHYIDNQTCYGLEQMVLNNLQADATYMKDYIAYDLMAYEGVNAPLHTFAFITLNGKPFGVYLAVEVYDTDYLSRVYGDTNIKLYNVKSSGLDEYENAIVDPETATVLESKGVEKATGMGSPGGPPPMGENSPSMGGAPPQGVMPPQMENSENPNRNVNANNSIGNMQQPPGGNGGDLVYVDDSTKSYNTIFANAVSKDTDAEDYAKIIRAIKYLNKQDVTEQNWSSIGT